MSREVRRVPLDFDAPIGEVWSGYLAPDKFREKKCQACEGNGYSAFARQQQNRWYGHMPFDPAETGSEPLTPETPAVRAFAERNVARDPRFYGRGEAAIVREAARLCGLWNGQWSHHLHQDDVDALVEAGRLHDFTHDWVKGDGWRPKNPKPTVTAREVNTWSLGGFGHDAINCWVVVKAACDRAGQPETCGGCAGHGSNERYSGQRAEAEAWTGTEPPAGDGWQLWSTTTEGHPMSPVFATGEELATWMSRNPCGFASATFDYEAALRFVGAGWSPSMVFTPETGPVDGITFVTQDGTR